MISQFFNRFARRSAVSTEPVMQYKFPALSDPDNVDSEVRPEQLLDQPEEQSFEDEVDIVNLVMSRFEEASRARRIHEREWLLCTAFNRGNQWVEWRDATNRLESLVDPNDPYRSYVTANKTRSATTKLKARATMSKPDASVKPLTPMPIDVAAAAEARDILEHYDQMFDRAQQTTDWVDSVMDTSTSFLKIIWNPVAEALTAYIPDDEQDQMQQSANPYMDFAPTMVVKSAPIGEIEEVVTPSFEVYPDPKARSWEECGWLIHCKLRTLTYIQEKYGDRGYRVRGEVTGQSPSSGYWEGRLDSITGETYRTASQTHPNSAYVYEMWEKPTPRYPKGRLIRVAGRVLLTEPDQLDWPYEKKDFPFVPLQFQKKFGTLWGLNAVHDLVPLQRHLNNILSRIVDRINTDKPTIMVPKGAEVGIDEYQSRRNFQKVYYEPGLPPTYQSPPPINAEWFQALEVINGLIEDISGVHEVSNGTVPPGVTAGAAIELLQSSDNTQLAEFVQNIEVAAKKRAEWEIALVAQYYAEPRLIAMSQEADKAVAAMNARSFVALTSGGRCRVEIIPGSALPKLPAQRQQQMLDILSAGGFTPEMLPVLKVFWDMMGLERSDTMPERLDYALKEITAYQQATQPNPAAAAQMQAQADLQRLQMQIQASESLEEVKGHVQAFIEHVKSANKIAEIQAEAQSNIQNDDRQLQRDAILQAQAKLHPNVTIAFKGDPQATVDLEKQLGLEGKIPPPEKKTTSS